VISNVETERVPSRPVASVNDKVSLSSEDQRLLQALKAKLEKAISERDVQEAAEIVFEIKSHGFHKSGQIDLTEANELIYSD